jgi:hypothetical protein
MTPLDTIQTFMIFFNTAIVIQILIKLRGKP